MTGGPPAAILVFAGRWLSEMSQCISTVVFVIGSVSSFFKEYIIVGVKWLLRVWTNGVNNSATERADRGFQARPGKTRDMGGPLNG